MATSSINCGAQENINTLFKRISYTYEWPSGFSLASNGSASITADNFGFSTPSGYTIAGVGRVHSGSVNVLVTGINVEATGSSSAMALKNLTTSAQTGKTSAIDIIYVRSNFMGTL